MSLIRTAGALAGAIALGGLLALGVRLVLPPTDAKRADRLPPDPHTDARTVRTIDVPGPAGSAERFQLQRDLDTARAQRTAALSALEQSEARVQWAVGELARRSLPPSPFEAFALPPAAAPTPRPRRKPACQRALAWTAVVVPAPPLK
jgi:hypothetical protein